MSKRRAPIGENPNQNLSDSSTGKNKKTRSKSSSVAIDDLTRVYGIGPAKAKKLVDSGITSIIDLRQHEEKLNRVQKLGLRFLEDIEKPIPRDEIEQIQFMIREKILQDYSVTICGSYRRGEPESDTIDILLSHPSFISAGSPNAKLLQDVIELLKQNLIIETFSMGNIEFSGLCKIPDNEDSIARRIEIHLTPDDQYICYVLYFTGPPLFNQIMRAHASENGYKLNRYSLMKKDSAGKLGDPLPIESEEDVFKYIGFPYKRPEERILFTKKL